TRELHRGVGYRFTAGVGHAHRDGVARGMPGAPLCVSPPVAAMAAGAPAPSGGDVAPPPHATRRSAASRAVLSCVRVPWVPVMAGRSRTRQPLASLLVDAQRFRDLVLFRKRLACG